MTGLKIACVHKEFEHKKHKQFSVMQMLELLLSLWSVQRYVTFS